MGSILALVACLASAAAPAEVHPTPAAAKIAASPQAATESAPSPFPDYLIAPGDVLRIAVWREPELSVETSVRLDGRITVPLLGDLMAAGRAPNDLAAEIQSKLSRFLEVPQVTLAVSQTVSARFYMLGEVAKPGVYPIPSRVTILQALALAGGFREFAKKESLLIIRQKADHQIAIPFNFKDVEAGVKLDQNIFIEPGDTIVVP
jgi:polysaccharide export outer membrane protein